MKKGIIFDLDGTLLDTIIDISEAVNFVLEEHKFPIHNTDSYKMFIGNGLEVLSRRALPKSVPEERFQILFSEIKVSFEKRQNTKTAAYEGVLSLLKELNNKGVKVAILSNKLHEFMDSTISRYFSDIRFEVIFGTRKGVKPKPSPEGVYQILEFFQLSKEDCFFVGDTSTDINTGINAGLETIGVTWGFRDKKELQEAKASFIVDKPSEILSLL